MNVKDSSFSYHGIQQSKSECMKENHKILKAIQNKISPLKINQKKTLEYQLKNSNIRLFLNKENVKINKQQPYKQESLFSPFQLSSNQNEQLTLIEDYSKIFKKRKKVVKSLYFNQKPNCQPEDTVDSQKFKLQRLPKIKKQLEQKKLEFTKNIQNSLTQYQKLSLRSQQKSMSFDYVINNLQLRNRQKLGNKSSQKGRKLNQSLDIEKKKNKLLRVQDDRGSGNNLKSFIEILKHRNNKRSYSPSVYISKKRIAPPKGEQDDEGEHKELFPVIVTQAGKEVMPSSLSSNVLPPVKSSDSLAKSRFKKKHRPPEVYSNNLQRQQQLYQRNLRELYQIYKQIDLGRGPKVPQQDRTKQNNESELAKMSYQLSEYNVKLRLRANHKKLIQYQPNSRFHRGVFSKQMSD